MSPRKTKGKKHTSGKKPQRKRNPNKQKPFSFKKWLLKWLFVCAVWSGVILAMIVSYYAYDMPDVNKLHEEFRTPSIKILDKNGNVLSNIGSLYGDYVPYYRIPQHLVDAVTSTEDRRFFVHFGIDPFGLIRAMVRNYIAGRVVQGGSTITQQLAKVVFLSHERTLKRKIQEMMLAFYLESNFTKEEIFTMYLNRIYLGSGNYGIDAAAKSYFGKSASELNLYESATIAGLIKAPSRYSPANNLALSQKRADQVLKGMVDNDILTTDEILLGAGRQSLVVTKHDFNSRNPYFVDWIKEQLSDYISNEQGEIIVRTTIDPRLQRMAESALLTRLSVLGEDHDVEQGAMIVMSPTGEVRAMVGGRSYAESQFNRATQAYRQPGSAFKLFVYLAAIENGYEPEDIMVDEPLEMSGWAPKNWNGRYAGEISIRNALAKSINTVAVRLAQKVGIKKVIKVARSLGISSPINKDLSSALGTSEVTLLELTGAYAHFANYGNAVWVYGISSIETDDGQVLYERQNSGGHRVISVESTAKMNDMLVNVIESGTGRQAKLDVQAAGKTGTSQNSRDAWFVGFTPDLVAGVWVGNDNNTPMSHVGGGGLPAIIWKDFMGDADNENIERKIPTTEYSVKQGRKKESFWKSFF